MYKVDEIIDFLTDLAGTDKINSNSDIFSDVGMVGDDFHEMIEKYSKKFSVDMSNYLWYFHADEEGSSGIGGAFFTAPYERVKRIPVTPLMLTNFANQQKWDIQYPEHSLPKKRYDLLINTVIGGLALTGFIIWIINKIIS
jgi:hypothetical protein